MNIPEWLKPGIYGVVTGAALTAAIGFTWGGWVTGEGANKMAMAMARADVVTALVPVCLETARADMNHAEKLAAIRSASTFQQRDAVMAAGWATVPGAEAPDRDLAQACLRALVP